MNPSRSSVRMASRAVTYGISSQANRVHDDAAVLAPPGSPCRLYHTDDSRPTTVSGVPAFPLPRLVRGSC